jgi:hypothetical protein
MNEDIHKVRTEEKRTTTEKLIRLQAKELASEMNLRLLCEMPLSDKVPVLWVEAIDVTDIAYPRVRQEKKKFSSVVKGFFKKLFRIVFNK